MLDLARGYSIALIGGHVSGASLFTATIAITGAATGNIPLRSAAKPGDKIAVTGTLGGSAAYVEMLEKKLKIDPDCAKSLRATFLHPNPRVKEGQLLVKEDIKADIDISDGVASDMRHICRASKVGAVVRAGLVPVNPVVKECFDARTALELALGGGEDYVLLFTGDESTIARVKAKSEIPITIIGDVVAEHPGGVKFIDSNGKSITLKRTGWDHFANPSGKS
jgi:thiamine-monophosphate kinase